MNILALDTSSRAASCAILRDGALAGEFFMNIGLTHSQTAMPMVEALMRQTMLSLREIDVFAVCTGPGSFTGLRIGIACVKGMAMAGDKPCAGASTLMALAAGVCLFEGYICPVMDARRGQVYTALFESTGGKLRRLREDEAISITRLGEILSELPSKVILTGDGARLCMEELSGVKSLQIAPERFLHQRACALADVAYDMAKKGETISAGKLAPSYLRLPQAERERLGHIE